MPWLMCMDRVLASLEVIDSVPGRLRGLLGRPSIDGAAMLVPAKAVHTVGLRFPIDVIYCRRHRLDDDGRAIAEGADDFWQVIDHATMKRFRVAKPRVKAHAVIEMPAGSCERLNIAVGDILQVCHEAKP